MRRLLNNPLTAIAILTGIILLCFGRTLGSYFLADDFGEVAYVARIFDGDLGLLWSNFTGNYMQVPSMAVYRPWLLMTLVFDFALWKTNAFGYYLTNLIHYLACSVLIYTLIRQLTGYWGKVRSSLAALFSAALFVVNPLHCESISWVVGRVDIVCLTYYLLSLNAVALFANTGRKRWLWGAVACFWIAICTKEMAIGLPVTATVLAFLFAKGRTDGSLAPSDSERISRPGDEYGPPPTAPGSTPGALEPGGSSRSTAVLTPATGQLVAALPRADWKDRIAAAAPVAIVLFASMAIYFVIRYVCLGTIGGGYVGSIGSSQFEGIVQKWTDVDTLGRIFYPLNMSVFAEGVRQRMVLTCLYACLFALATARVIVGAVPRRWLLLLAAIAVTALAPIYQLYGIGYDLEGSRFVFFFTVPLSMLLPILLFAPLTREKGALRAPLHGGVHEAIPAHEPVHVHEQIQKIGNKLLWGSILALSALIAVFGYCAERNNIPWIHAGKQTRALSVKAPELARTIPQGKQVAVVGIPKDSGGAHMILNNSTFRNLITPPFVGDVLTKKILTFDPVLFGDMNRIDTRHFKEALRNSDVERFLRWDMDQRQFVEFQPRTPHAVAAFDVPVQAGSGLKFTGLQIQPADFDFINLELRNVDRSTLENKSCKIAFQSVSGAKSEYDFKLSQRHMGPGSDAGTSVVRIPLSYYWRWYSFGPIAAVSAQLPLPDGASVVRARFVPYTDVAPDLIVVNRKTSNDGAYAVKTTDRVELATWSLRDPRAETVELQILKKNYFFENLSEGNLAGSIAKTMNVDRSVILPLDVMKEGSGGYVQLRARCLDAANQQVGEFSLPVTLRVGAW